MIRLYRYCIQHPRRVIASAVLLSAVVSPGVLRLRLRTDGHALVPHDAPEIAVDRAIREVFGIDDPVVVVIHSNDSSGIFNAHTLALLDDLTTIFKAMDGVRPGNVFSLATEYGDRVFPGTLRFRRLLEPLPTTPEELERLRDDIRAIKLYSGTMLSFDEKAAAILVGAAPGVDRVDLYRRIGETIESRGDIPEKVAVIGAPVAEALLGTHILEDLGVPNVLLGHRTRSHGMTGTERVSPPSQGLGHPVGFPKSAYDVQVWIARWIGLVPVALGVMAFVFFVCHRSWPAVVLPLLEAGTCLIVVFALMGWCGVPVYLTIAVMPIILTAAGVMDEMHVFARYRERLADSQSDDHRAVLLSTMEEMGRTIIMTNTTAGFGFLAFALSPIGPVRAFGVFTAIGMAFCLLWTLIVIPACLSLINAEQVVGRRRAWAGGSAAPRMKRWFGALGSGVVRFRGAVLMGALALGIVAPLGIREVVVQDSWIDGFAPESEFRQATDAFDEQFLGAHTLLVCVDSGRQRRTGEIVGAAFDMLWTKLPGDVVDDPASLVGWRLRFKRPSPRSDNLGHLPPPAGNADAQRRAVLDTWSTWVTEAKREGDNILVKGIPSQGLPKIGMRLTDTDRVGFEITPSRLLRPDTVRRIGELESFIETQKAEAVGGVVGTAEYVRTINFLRRGRKEAERSIPNDAEQIEWCWREYGRIRGEERVRQLVDAEYARSIVTVLMKDANFVGTARLMENIRAYEAEKLAPHGITLSFAGDVAVSQTLIGAIVGTQVISVAAALAGDFVVTALIGRSLVFGLLCIIPSSLAVLMNFALMGWLGMPLGVATSMFSSMTLGIGVDYAIHLMQYYGHERAAGASRKTAVIEAMKITGPAILGNTLAVTLGFGVLMLSQVPANARLGGLLVLSLFNCFAATMLVLPAVLGRRDSTDGSSGSLSMDDNL
ncbi:MAG: MMPL family transporter [Phycisphaerales bacterium]|nr:MMPL family transporter [Phycisphaerales bacterium]